MRRTIADRRFGQHFPLFQIDGHQEIARRVWNVRSPPIMTYGRRAGLPADRYIHPPNFLVIVRHRQDAVASR